MISVKGLTKNYNDKVVIKNENFDIPEKGITVIKGESGAGKTTLLNCILEYDNSYEGQIIIDNYHAKKQKRKYRRNNIGIVLQYNSLIEEETVKYNLELALRIAGKNIDERKIDYCLELVNLKNYKKRTVESLSGGQKQRVAIARALIISPKYIFLDEPTSNLDYDNSIEIFSILKSLSKKISIIVISHDEKVYEQFADNYIIVSKNGYQFNKGIDSEDIVVSKRKNDSTFKFKNGTIQIEDGFAENIKLYLYNNKIYIDSNLEVVKGMPEIKVEEKVLEEVEFDVDGFSLDEAKKAFKPFINVSLFLALSLISILTIIMFNLHTDESFVNFRYSNENVYLVQLDIYKRKEEINKVKQSKDVIILPYEHEMTFEFKQNKLNQSLNSTRSISFICTPLPITDCNLMFGKMPENDNEILLDSSLIDKLKNENEAIYYYGNYGYRSFIGTEVALMGYDNKAKIVGIANTSTPTLYLRENKINELCLMNAINEYKYIPCSSISNKNDIYLSYNEYNNYTNAGLNKIVIDDFEYSIIGYKDYLADGTYEVSEDRMDEMIEEEILMQQTQLRCYTSEKENIKDMVALNALELELENFQNKTRAFGIITKIVGIVFLMINILVLYFSLKTTILQNKERINVVRLLGYDKLHKDFLILGVTIALFVIPGSTICLFLINNLFNSMGIQKLAITINIEVVFTLIGFILITIMISLILLYLKFIKKRDMEIINEMK